jgi:hypothetical protein
MSKVALSGNVLGTGTVTLAAPNTASDVTLTLPAVTAELITNSSGVLNIGSGQIYKDASGNVGVGTASPAYKFDVRGGVLAVGNGTIVGGISYSSRTEIGAISNHPLGFITNNVTQMLLDTSGNLGIGTSSPTSYAGYKSITVENSTGGVLILRNTANTANLEVASNSTETYIKNVTNTPLTFGTNNTERMRIDSSGRLLVGTTGLLSGMTGQFAVGVIRQIALETSSGSILIRSNAEPWAMGTYYVGSSGTNRGGFGAFGSSDALTYYWVGTSYNGTGVTLSYGGTSWATLSDEREKNIYGVIENALDKVLQFDGVYFNYKSDKPEQRRRVGFSAQKVQAVFPEAVDESQREIDNPTEETKRLTLSATEIIPLLVQAVKELTARLEVLENK